MWFLTLIVSESYAPQTKPTGTVPGTRVHFLIRDDEKTSVRGPEARQDAENAEEFHFPRKEIDNFRIAVHTGSVRVRNL